jgi:hypothetical protein
MDKKLTVEQLKKVQPLRFKEGIGMREIKFRAWDKNNDVMWSWVEIVKGDGILELVFTFPERFTPLQYTGLKDKNGKEIYERDVAKTVALLNDHNQRGATDTLVVRNWMGNSCLCFDGQESGTPIYPLIVSHEIEVIGNIYENPELLGGENNG